MVAGWLPFNYFKIASLEYSWYFPVCFLEFGTVMLFQMKLFPFGTDITCNLTSQCGLPLLLVKKYLSFQLELNFVFLSHFSFGNHFCKFPYLTKAYFIGFTMHIFKRENQLQTPWLATKIKINPCFAVTEYCSVSLAWCVSTFALQQNLPQMFALFM